MLADRHRILGCALALVLCLLGPACGGAAGETILPVGTVALHNRTDQGMAPQTVTAFFLVPVGTSAPGPNLLVQALDPGGIVIVGLYPAGTYNAVAVLAGGLNVQFMDRVVIAGQPADFIVPGG